MIDPAFLINGAFAAVPLSRKKLFVSSCRCHRVHVVHMRVHVNGNLLHKHLSIAL